MYDLYKWYIVYIFYKNKIDGDMRMNRHFKYLKLKLRLY